MFLLRLIALALLISSSLVESISARSNVADLQDMLEANKIIIETLRQHIDTLSQRVQLIKSKTEFIQKIHDNVQDDVDAYLHNPINVLTILKRLTTEWPELMQYANDNVDSVATEMRKNTTKMMETLNLPSEADYEEAVDNLLLLQDIYGLNTERLAFAEINGIKSSSKMSWSDYLEIGRKSNSNGNFEIAKYWMDTFANSTEAEENIELRKSRAEIFHVIMNTEHRAGNMQAALNAVDELMQIHPKNKSLKEAKARIERKLSKRKQSKKFKKQLTKVSNKKKSAEDRIFSEICLASAANSNKFYSESFVRREHFCQLERANLPQLLLQPLHTEILSVEPYILLQHNALTKNEVNTLQGIIETAQIDELIHETLQNKVSLLTGHAAQTIGSWSLKRKSQAEIYPTDTYPSDKSNSNSVAHVMLALQTAKHGGNIVFPQLELNVQLSNNELLYWSNLNEYKEQDYRTQHFVCPVIAGTQIYATSAIHLS